jgi:hypothetical protein
MKTIHIIESDITVDARAIVLESQHDIKPVAIFNNQEHVLLKTRDVKEILRVLRSILQLCAAGPDIEIVHDRLIDIEHHLTQPLPPAKT